jgi:hypothetical protein
MAFPGLKQIPAHAAGFKEGEQLLLGGQVLIVSVVCVQVGNHHVGLSGIDLSKLLICRSQSLAMAAPAQSSRSPDQMALTKKCFDVGPP